MNKGDVNLDRILQKHFTAFLGIQVKFQKDMIWPLA